MKYFDNFENCSIKLPGAEVIIVAISACIVHALLAVLGIL